ncbi:MAG: sulfite exporter TauE/SafE [Limisphaerales bacterium]|jgi:sulfite exporter TauE/SafE
MLSVWLGFFAGAIHVVAGPDHLAAIAPLSAREGRGAALGFRWGIGHSGGVLLVGLLALIFRDLFPLEALSEWSERIVGVTLVAIGLWGIHVLKQNRIHAHEHAHGAVKHVHPHVHFQDRDRSVHRHSHAAWLIGVLHGFAGSSHLFGVLPAIAMPTVWQAGLYLLSFGVGTIAAMTLFASGIGRISRVPLFSRFGPHAMFGLCSVAAVACGTYWIFA